MKFALNFWLVCLLFVVSSQTSVWAEEIRDYSLADIESVKTRSKKEKKNSLFLFVSDFCCMRCGESGYNFINFGDPGKILKKHYNMMLIDIGNRDRNMELLGQFVSEPEASLPIIVILSPQGKTLVISNGDEFFSGITLKAWLLVDFLKKYI